MPKRNDINSILIIGSGPIIIGQACEFDYSGTQACAALKEEGYRVILINSNPATIMTDPQLVDATYIEPICCDVIENIIKIEKPDAILPTMGGQTALNCAIELHQKGILEKYKVELIGAKYESINKAEDRERFKAILKKIGLSTPKSFAAYNINQAKEILLKVGLPAIIRPSFTLGGFGGGVAHTEKQYNEICLQALMLSPQHEIQIDESIYGWKEYELEVMRDKNDNSIIVCSIENLDPVGIHTGDSITVAPAQTLTDKEYQQMRNAAIAIMREIGVDTGGANVQFAVHPKDGRMLVIEMNPRVSRSSALASKATGYPIARLAAKLAVGYTLNELLNDITAGQIPASFEPALDYVVTKIPRFDLDKFPTVSNELGSQMKSVGEVMAIGRTFQESLQKAILSLERNLEGLDISTHENKHADIDVADEMLATPSPYRILYVAEAFRKNKSVNDICKLTQIDSWFLYQIKELIDLENDIKNVNLADITARELNYIKQKGFSDTRLANLLNVDEKDVRLLRKQYHCIPSYKNIDTCAAEFHTQTDYIYSSYDLSPDEPRPDEDENEKIIIIGSGPNRIGQGIEFDYCCVHAVQAVRNAGLQAIMINCNPETVSTDYNVSNKLYFEPVTYEKVLDIIENENPQGVIVQFGGQTPLKLVEQLHESGVTILGSSHEAISKTENRDKFKAIVAKLGLLQPPNTVAYNAQEALRLAPTLHYPLIVRPSFVLGGRAMKIVHNDAQLISYLSNINRISFDHPLLLEHFIDDAIEIDVDAVSDGSDVIICGILEQVEKAGVHSGDSACCFPAISLSQETVEKIKKQVTEIILEIGATGLVNAQFAVKNDEIYIIEVNPRASRTIPFISKATGVPWVNIAVNCILGKSLQEQDIKYASNYSYYAVKESVFPFVKLPGSVPLLGPEMKSTGEVMGLGVSFNEAFYKAQKAAGFVFSNSNTNRYVLITELDTDNDRQCIDALIAISEKGLKIISDQKYQSIFESNKINCHMYYSNDDTKAIKEMIANGDVVLIINLASKFADTCSDLLLFGMRLGIAYATSAPAMYALLYALSSKKNYDLVKPIQKYHEKSS